MALFEFLNIYQHFQVSHQTNHLFNLVKGSTNASLKFETMDKLKQNTGKDWESYSNSIFKFQYVFRLVSEFTSNPPHQSSANYRANLKFSVLNSDLRNEIRDLTSQKPLIKNHKNARSFKNAAC